MTSSTADLPAGVTHVTITCDSITQLVADSTDSGSLADGLPLDLDVEFVAPVDWERYPGSGLLFLDAPVRARVVNGILCDQLGMPGVGLIAPREGWTWTCRLLQGRRVRAQFPILVQPSPATQRLDDIMVASALPGSPIVQGESAYDVAVRNGYSGTEAQWVASLKGDPGESGFVRNGGAAFAGDLNTLVGGSTAGTYSVAASATNAPTSAGGSLIVAAPSTTVTSQYYAPHPSAADAGFYARAFSSGTWGPWRILNRRDTGWRDISASLINGWTGIGGTTGVGLRRIDEMVIIRVRSLNGAAATSDVFATLPTAFIPPSADGGLALMGSAVRGVQVFTNGEARIVGGAGQAGAGAPGAVSYTVTAPWPTTLPGVPG